MEREAIVREAFRPKEVAQMHGFGLSTIYREIGLGNLKTRRLGRAVVILRSDLDAWLDSLDNGEGASGA